MNVIKLFFVLREFEPLLIVMIAQSLDRSEKASRRNVTSFIVNVTFSIAKKVFDKPFMSFISEKVFRKRKLIYDIDKVIEVKRFCIL